MNENHYKTLGVAPTASLETIKQAYRQQIRQYHPDTYVARRQAIQKSGDISKLRALEKEIESSKAISQRINAAYAILSDVDSRAKYDQSLAKERQVQQVEQDYRRRMRHSDEGRRTVKTRPHRPPQTKSNNASWGIAVGFIVLLFFASSILSNTLFRQDTYVTAAPRNTSRAGEINVYDAQDTAIARRATQAARETIVALPTHTPRSAEDNERLADSMMELGQYHLAIEGYSDAIERLETSNLYTKRALAYSAAYFSGQARYAELASADFEAAIALDSNYALAYRGRGWLYYQIWLDSKSALDAQIARADFQAYLALVEADSEIEIALQELGD